MSDRLKRIDELAQLKDGWNDGKCPAPNSISVENAKRVMKTLDTLGIDYHIYPIYDGGIQFEFDAGEIQCLNDGSVIEDDQGDWASGLPT